MPRDCLALWAPTASRYSRWMPAQAALNDACSNRWILLASSRVSTFTAHRHSYSATWSDGRKALARTLDQAAIALANEMVGGAQKLLDSAVDYAKVRVQFGRTIGSFQAIKHRLADLLLDRNWPSRPLTMPPRPPRWTIPEWPALACLAKAAASETYLRAAIECIQLHGGIGFTWDNDTHLWFKRAKSSEVFLGQPSYHRELLMQRWEV